MSLLYLPYRILDFTCRPKEELYLPEFKGSTFRGVLGRALKSALCVLKTQPECKPCPLVKNCYYAYLFETIPVFDSELPFNLHKYPSVPHPFILEPPLEDKTVYNSDEPFTFRIILVGRSLTYEAYFIMAFRLAGEIGMGKGRKNFEIEEVTSRSGELTIKIPSPEELESSASSESKVDLRFITPLRLIYERKLVRRELGFHHIVRNLLRRVSALYYFHQEQSLPTFSPKSLIEHSEKVLTLRDNLFWKDWERYSFRQKRRIPLGGLVGEITFQGPLSPFLSLLRAGEILHCGKNTSFGLGKFTIAEFKT